MAGTDEMSQSSPLMFLFIAAMEIPNQFRLMRPPASTPIVMLALVHVGALPQALPPFPRLSVFGLFIRGAPMSSYLRLLNSTHFR